MKTRNLVLNKIKKKLALNLPDNSICKAFHIIYPIVSFKRSGLKLDTLS